MNYIVYKTTNIINSKIYIGVHYTNPDVFDGYIGCGVSKKDKKKKTTKGFPVAVRKYGYENFKRETLFVYPDTEEGRIAAYAKEEEIVTPEFVAREDTYNLTVGGRFANIDKWKRKISQYAIDGTFIRSWNSIADAERELGLTSITACILGHSRYAGDFQWRYYTDESNISHTTLKTKSVYQFDLQGNLIKVYKSISEASQQFDNFQSAKQLISRCCHNLRQQVYGYYWSFKNKFEYNPKYHDTELPVAKYNDDGEFLESYSSVYEAAKAINMANHDNIMHCIRGYSKHCGGFRWRFFYGNKNNIAPLIR